MSVIETALQHYPDERRLIESEKAVSEFVTMPETLRLHLYLVYGISIFMGFISALILGQTFKTLPFKVWLHRYQHLVGKTPVPQPKDLSSDRLLKFQNLSYLGGFVLLLSGAAQFSQKTILAGGLLLLLAAIIYSIQVFRLLLLSFSRSETRKNVENTPQNITHKKEICYEK